MHRATLVALIIVFVLVMMVCCSRCACGCYPWCSCRSDPAHKCCCVGGKNTHPEHFMVNNHRQVTLHYTDWCSACKNFKPIWGDVKAAIAGPGIQFIELNEDIVKTPGVTSYPTVRMITESGRTVEYKGGHDFTALRNWIVSPNPYEY